MAECPRDLPALVVVCRGKKLVAIDRVCGHGNFAIEKVDDEEAE